jgi:1-acyl-sn-glycerol-3-phosphate acyltransferase
MLAFNHSSYMDALVLATVLPGEPAIVAKRELSDQRIAGPLLRRLGIPFVERYDVSGSLADAKGLVDLARRGRLLVFFPEGTFTRRPGLSGFYMGAFKVAAEANLPIFPGVIRGTRSMLRGDQWFPRRLPAPAASHASSLDTDERPQTRHASRGRPLRPPRRLADALVGARRLLRDPATRRAADQYALRGEVLHHLASAPPLESGMTRKRRPAPWHAEAKAFASENSTPTRMNEPVPMLPAMKTGWPTDLRAGGRLL